MNLFCVECWVGESRIERAPYLWDGKSWCKIHIVAAYYGPEEESNEEDGQDPDSDGSPDGGDGPGTASSDSGTR